jgi:hypothetical protein
VRGYENGAHEMKETAEFVTSVRGSFPTIVENLFHADRSGFIDHICLTIFLCRQQRD